MSGDSQTELGDAGPAFGSPEAALFGRARSKAIECGAEILRVPNTGGERPCNYAGQLKDAFRRKDFGIRLRTDFFSGVDHTLMAEQGRTRIVCLIN